MAYMTANFEHLRVRVNVTWQGTLLELTETSALVRVPTAPPTDRQTTVVISGEDGDTIYLPGRVVLSIPQTWGPGRAKQEHHIVVEFFEDVGGVGRREGREQSEGVFFVQFADEFSPVGDAEGLEDGGSCGQVFLVERGFQPVENLFQGFRFNVEHR